MRVFTFSKRLFDAPIVLVAFNERLVFASSRVTSFPTTVVFVKLLCLVLSLWSVLVALRVIFSLVIISEFFAWSVWVARLISLCKDWSEAVSRLVWLVVCKSNFPCAYNVALVIARLLVLLSVMVLLLMSVV